MMCIDHMYKSVCEFLKNEAKDPTLYWQTTAPAEFDVLAPIYIHEWHEQANKSSIMRLRNVYASNGSNKSPGSIILFGKPIVYDHIYS